MHHWVQVTEPVAAKLEAGNLLATGNGYKYVDGGTPMREYHVDCINPEKSKDLLQQLMATDFGGNLSVRFKQATSKPLICFGHDEYIFKQSLMPSKQWYGPNKETFICPKDEGLGTVISAFQSREFGFGLETTELDLKEVNRQRDGVRYRDTHAVLETRKSKYKAPLTTSPFLCGFKYGQNADGYWTYQHMVLQIEDCVDVLNIKYSQYDFLFLFDHSCGHNRQ